jgi:hypothetical protein
MWRVLAEIGISCNSNDEGYLPGPVIEVELQDSLVWAAGSGSALW